MRTSELLKNMWLKQGRDAFLTIGGTIILSFGAAIFTIPFQLVAGGMTGLAIILDTIITAEFITIDLIVSILTWLFFALGWIFLGNPFAVKTLIAAIVYPIGISLFTPLVSPDLLGGFLYLQGSEHSAVSLLLAAAAGGLFVGIGCALTFLGGASTGGVDIVALIICRYFPRVKSSDVIFTLDVLIILLGMVVIGDLTLALLGILHAFICAAVIDRVFLGSSRALKAEIITQRHDGINTAIIRHMGRTTTLLDATGGYSGKTKKMLIVSFTMAEYATLLRLVREADEEAFVTVYRIHEVNGSGWTK